MKNKIESLIKIIKENKFKDENADKILDRVRKYRKEIFKIWLKENNLNLLEVIVKNKRLKEKVVGTGEGRRKK